MCMTISSLCSVVCIGVAAAAVRVEWSLCGGGHVAYSLLVSLEAVGVDSEVVA